MCPEEQTHHDRQSTHTRTNGEGSFVAWAEGGGPDITSLLLVKILTKEKRKPYDPIIFPNCETQLISASATALFAGGWETEELAQAKKQMKPAYACVMRNLTVERN